MQPGLSAPPTGVNDVSLYEASPDRSGEAESRYMQEMEVINDMLYVSFIHRLSRMANLGSIIIKLERAREETKWFSRRVAAGSQSSSPLGKYDT